MKITIQSKEETRETKHVVQEFHVTEDSDGKRHAFTTLHDDKLNEIARYVLTENEVKPLTDYLDAFRSRLLDQVGVK